ncbi:MAG: hypothetical protein HY696_02750 [Deltaproteobacteria bacterium]|nr:hypothetical protein [Deltaproteobacteria bacterium]
MTHTNHRWELELAKLFASVRDGEEARELMTALLSPAERRDIAERWQIVKHLIAGRTQREVRDLINVSIATVTRGAREVRYGSGALQKFYRRVQKTATPSKLAA